MRGGASDRHGHAGRGAAERKQKDCHHGYRNRESASEVRLKGINDEANKDIRRRARDVLRIAKEQNDSNEVMIFYNISSHQKSEIYSGSESYVSLPKIDKIFKGSYEKEIILIHNHSSGKTLSYMDWGVFVQVPKLGAIMVVTNMGRIRLLRKEKNFSYDKVEEIINSIKNELGINGDIVGELQNQAMEEFLSRARAAGLEYVRA